MKTAKEFKKEMDNAAYYGEYGRYIEERDRFIEALCREQRKICDESVRFEDGILLDDSIINAPMPEI